MSSHTERGAGRRHSIPFVWMVWLASLGGLLALGLLPVGQVHAAASAVLALDPGGARVLVGDERDRGLRIWDLSGQAPGEVIPLEAAPTAVTVHPVRRIALVVHGRSDRVSVLDLEGGGTLGAIRVGRDPAALAIDASRDLAVVVNARDDTVTLIDLGTLAEVATVRVGRGPVAVVIHEAGGMAIVSSEKGDELTFVDLDARKVKATLAVAGNPGALAIDPQIDRLLIAHEKSDAVTILRPSDGAVLATLPTGRSPVAAAIQPGTGRALVANARDDSLSLIDLQGAIVLGTVPAGRAPAAVVIAPHGLAVVGHDRDQAPRFIDLAATAYGSSAPVGRDPRGIAIHSTGALAVVANEKDDSVSVLSLPSLEMRATVRVGRRPWGVALDPARDLAAITLGKEDRVALLDLAAMQAIGTVKVGRDPRGIAIDPGLGVAVVAHAKDDTIGVVDLDGRTLAATIRVGRDPHGVAIQNEERRAWLSLERDDAVQVIDLDSRTVISTLAVGRRPAGIAISPALRLAAVANAGDASLTLIDVDRLEVLTTLPVGRDPRSVAFDERGGQILVVNHGVGAVSAVDMATLGVRPLLPAGKHPQDVAVDSDARLALISSKGDDEIIAVRLPEAGAPEIIVDFPPDHLLTNHAELMLTGSVSRTASLTVSGEPVDLDPDRRFLHRVLLEEGLNGIELIATDPAGSRGAVKLTVYLDTMPPEIPAVEGIDVSEPVDGQVAVTGGAGSVEPGGLVSVTNRRTGESAGVVADAFGGFSLVIAGTDGDAYAITVTDGAGNTSAEAEIVPPVGLPPDPAVVAPALDSAVPTSIFDATAFLYAGPNPIQEGVEPGVIDPSRTAVLRGRIGDREGRPIAGVTLSVAGHPEYGWTRSRADGVFDLAVNGGGSLTVRYERPGYLPVQRRIEARWHDYAWLPDVVMIPLDEEVTTIDLASQAPVQVARGGRVTDADGARQATLLFSRGTAARLVLADGSLQPIPTLNVRATEYTVGETGSRAMPGELPPTSGYTYAVELSVDEALAAGAQEVRFDRPVHLYVENFPGFPVGGVVPAGWYDRARAAWIPSENGRIVRVLSIEGGTAELDVTGDGSAADGTALAILGISEDERRTLATLYVPGQELWRVPVEHFTPWDCNWPYGPPPDARRPEIRIPEPDPREENPSCQAGSIIECENQVLGATLPVAGTRLTLNYRSDRVPGRRAGYTLKVPLSGAALPDSLRRIDLEIAVAGRRFSEGFPAQTGQVHQFTWDGRDGYGRTVYGVQKATVRVGYVYEVVYYEPAEVGRSFAIAGAGPLSAVRGRSEITLWHEAERVIGGHDARSLGLGGWSLDRHHHYSPRAGLLNRGDGRRRSASDVGAIVTTFAGNGEPGYAGDGGPAIGAQMRLPVGMAAAPDGSLYFADGGFFASDRDTNHRVRRVGPDGVITTVAGGGAALGDGGAATSARLGMPADVAVGPDGSVYIADAGAGNEDGEVNHRIRRVGPDGIITTVAGTGVPGYGGDGGPATEAQLYNPMGVAIGPDGSLYISDWMNSRVRRVDPDGIITTVAGNGTWGFSGDGGPATLARIGEPAGMAIGADGGLYFADWSSNRIRHVSPDGIIRTVAGGGTDLGADGVPATRAQLFLPSGVAVGRDGSLFIADHINNRVRHVAPDGIITTVAGNGEWGSEGDGGLARAALVAGPTGVALGPDGSLYVSERTSRIRRIAARLTEPVGTTHVLSSGDGAEYYVFDIAGRHLSTVDGATGASLLDFDYDGRGYLTRIEDGDGNVVRIERDGADAPVAIIAPDGQRSDLALDAAGYLAAIANPAGETHHMGYTALGLLTQLSDPMGNVRSYEHDAMGRLTATADPAGGGWALSRIEIGHGSGGSGGYETSLTSAEGLQSRFRVEYRAAGDRLRTILRPDGTATSIDAGQGGRHAYTLPDGTTVTLIEDPDPRFGMNAPFPGTLIVRTPSGLTNESSVRRAAVTAGTADSLDAVELSETVVRNGRSWSARYTESEREWIHTTPAGRIQTGTSDTRGRIVHWEVAGLEPMTHDYDSRGRLTGLRQAPGTAAERGYAFGYGADGYLATLSDPLSRILSFEYDAAGRLIRKTSPDGRVLALDYDANGRLSAIVPPGGGAHLFSYTPTGLEEQYAPPPFGDAQTVTRYGYTPDGRLTRVERPDGQSIALHHDAGGRLSTASTPQGPYLYHYHPGSGQLAGVLAPGGVGLAFAWDGFLPVGESLDGQVSGTVSRSYDHDFRLAAVAVNGEAVALAYDDDGLVVGAGELTIGRDAGNGLPTATVLDGVATAITHNGFGEPVEVTTSHDGTLLARFTYARDLLGRIVARSEEVSGGSLTESYTYDAAGRLARVNRNGVVTEWGYDQNGNRTHIDGVRVATHDEQDRLLTYGSASYSHTEAGELSGRTAAGATTRYEYDVFGNLRRVVLPGDVVIDYVIDGLNRRVGKIVDGVLVQGLLYQDQLNPVAEIDATGAVKTRFVYADRPNVPAYMIRDGVTYLILADHLGSPRLVVNTADGGVAQRIDYDVWGQVVLDTNPGFQPFGFAGGIYDQHTGLLRFGARDYDPRTGRWTSKDPIRFAGGDTNLYGYVLNDPINHMDPDGMVLVHVVGALLGGAAGGLAAATTGQPVAAGMLTGVISGAGLGGSVVANAALGAFSGVAGHLWKDKDCEFSALLTVRAAFLGAIGGVVGRELGMRSGLIVARGGEGAGYTLGYNNAVISSYYAQAVGGGLASAGISAATQP